MRSRCSRLLMVLTHPPPSLRSALDSPTGHPQLFGSGRQTQHQSGRCLPTGGARPLRAPQVQPETIHQQAGSPACQQHAGGHAPEAQLCVWPGENGGETQRRLKWRGGGGECKQSGATGSDRRAQRKPG